MASKLGQSTERQLNCHCGLFDCHPVLRVRWPRPTAPNCHIAADCRATELCTSGRQTKAVTSERLWLLISEKSPFPPQSRACFPNQTRGGRILDTGETIPTGCRSSHVIEVCSLVAASVVIPLPASDWMCWRLPALPACSIHCNVWPWERLSILMVQGPQPKGGARMQGGAHLHTRHKRARRIQRS